MNSWKNRAGEQVSETLFHCDQLPGFSLGRLHMGGFVPHMGGTSAGGQSVNGGDS